MSLWLRILRSRNLFRFEATAYVIVVAVIALAIGIANLISRFSG